ncbi:MFS transporter [Nocardioides sp.]|uniref:MFS transporter n=1 Tax=Nocardioides sp. TaxID=35761 RepID=UPI002ED59A96
MTATATATNARLARPGFVAWLAAATVSSTGDGVLYFALAWTASGIGPGAVTVVMVAGLVPEVLLTLAGGVLADRWGVRRTLLGCTAAMSALIVVLLAADRGGAPLFSLLVAVAIGQGVVGSLMQPASNVMPRLFVADDDLPRAMAIAGSVLSVARLAGPPLGALVVVGLGLDGALVVDLVSFLLVAGVLGLVRPPYERRREPAAEASAWSDVAAGLRAVGRVPGIRPLLTSLALVAGGLLPLLALGVPLLARERGWAATTAGVIEACWIAGTLAVGLLVARVGTRDNPRPPLVAGPVLAGLGVVALALAPAPGPAYAAAVVMGIGTAVYTTHVFPLYVLRSPDDMLARFQSVLILVQMVMMLVGNLLAGGAIGLWGVTPVLLAAAVVCAAAAVPVLGRRALSDPVGG